MLKIHVIIRSAISISINAEKRIRNLGFFVIAAAKYAIIINAATIIIDIKNPFIVSPYPLNLQM